MTTKLQRLAQRENWAIYLMKGMKIKLHFFRKVVNPLTIDRMQNALDDAIAEIKLTQSDRKDLRQ